MPVYRVAYKKSAVKTLLKMPRPLALRFEAAFEQLAQNPSDEGLDVRPLSGRDGYRLRVGDWRALYRIEADQLVIEVIRIGPRGDIYK